MRMHHVAFIFFLCPNRVLVVLPSYIRYVMYNVRILDGTEPIQNRGWPTTQCVAIIYSAISSIRTAAANVLPVFDTGTYYGTKWGDYGRNQLSTSDDDIVMTEKDIV